MVELSGSRCVAAPSASVSLVGWLLGRLRRRPNRLGNADDLPERMRRDMGLAQTADWAARHYRDYLQSHGF